MKTLWPTPDSIRDISDHQRSMYAQATTGPVSLVIGNPGAGKSFLVGRILRSLSGARSNEVAVAAPTGKAAIRITEELYKLDIELQATTIHRMLGVTRNGHDGEGWGFNFCEARPLPYRYVFVDEVSMLDSGLAANLVAACQQGTHLFFTGDWGQLPPVGHGAPLRDMLAAGLPHGELTEIHRNEGDIVRVCRELKAKQPYIPSPTIDPEAGKNCFHIECRYPQAIMETIVKMISGSCYGYDPVWDVQVICARNGDATAACRDSLNKALQQALNPPRAAPAEADDKFALSDAPPVDVNHSIKGMRLNDKVICNSNGMYPIVACPNQFCGGRKPATISVRGSKYQCDRCDYLFGAKEFQQDFVANGEIGKITTMGSGFFHVSFDAPKRMVRFGGEHTSSMELAYCVTCHKSQGSQWPIVIIVADDGGDRVTSWEWHRTGLSRAQHLAVTVGKLATIRRQCQVSALEFRKTFLKERLCQPS